MAGMSLNMHTHHHDRAVREEHWIATPRSDASPFPEDSKDLFNLIMPDEVKHDLCRLSEIGKMLFDVFVAEYIKSGETNLWSPMKKQVRLTYGLL